MAIKKVSQQVIKEDIWHKIGSAGEPAFQNSWVNYETVETNWSHAYFMKDAMGFVHIKGMVKSGSPVTSVIFTLPAGYRPLKYHRWATISYDALANMEIRGNGEIVVVAGNAGWLNLGLVTFKAEQ